MPRLRRWIMSREIVLRNLRKAYAAGSGSSARWADFIVAFASIATFAVKLC